MTESRWKLIIPNQTTYCATRDFARGEFQQSDFCTKYIWNHGIVRWNPDGELLLFPFSKEAIDACENADQHEISADEKSDGSPVNHFWSSDDDFDTGLLSHYISLMP